MELADAPLAQPLGDLLVLVLAVDSAEADLIGIEYIVSERLFGTLPEGERHYWHPHNFRCSVAN